MRSKLMLAAIAVVAAIAPAHAATRVAQASVAPQPLAYLLTGTAFITAGKLGRSKRDRNSR